MNSIKFAVTLALAAFSVVVTAAETAESVTEKLKAIMPPNVVLESISETEMPGVYLADLGGQMVNVFADGDHLMVGEVYNITSRTSLLDQARGRKTGEEIAKLSVDDMIVFGPEDAERYVTVFTDIDCGYCRKLHREMDALNQGGLQVRYLAFPRAGIGSASYDKAVSVWCADDQQQAMTDAKADRPVKPAICENPVEEQYRLGQRVGVRGTPTLILDDGTIIPGYVPADQLLERIGMK